MTGMPEVDFFTALPASWMRVLVDATLKGTLLILIAGVVIWIWRKNSAADRSYLWTLVVSVLLLLPLFSSVIPKWSSPILPGIPLAFEERSLRQPSSTTPSPDPVSAGSAMTAEMSRRPETDKIPAAWPTRVLLLWAGGSSLILAWLLIGKATIWWTKRRGEPLESEDWNRLNRDVARELALARQVRLVKSKSAAVAMVSGFGKPTVVLPACAEEWNDERRRVVLLHEFAHIKRRDSVSEGAAQLASVIHWFNPLVWLAIRQNKRERERACDDAVITAGIRPSAYAYHLMEVAKDMSMDNGPIWRAATVSQASSLKDRLLCILNPNVERIPKGRHVTAWTTILITALAIPLAAFHPWAPATQGISDLQSPQTSGTIDVRALKAESDELPAARNAPSSAAIPNDERPVSTPPTCLQPRSG